ncbi:MAG: FtsW/RodA/SpoVE family cell cycle protein [Chloroflexi bacterium]|nr:FtsW/RodA/SpoVE family cell cycle protein [Chloroflexota bacterium]
MTFLERATKLDKRQPQSRLLIMGAVFLSSYGIALTLSPFVDTRIQAPTYRWTHWLAIIVWILVVMLAHRQSVKLVQNRDPLLLPISAILSGWGLLTIWRLTSRFGLRQTIWLIIALGLYTLGLRIKNNLGFLRRYKYLWLFAGLGLTALTIFFGTNPLGTGPRLWLGCCGIYLQPSEPLKLLLLIFIAAYLADRQPLSTKLLPLIAPTIFMTSLALLLLLIQRDLGTGAVFALIYTAVLYVGTRNRRVLLIILIVLLLAGFVGYSLFGIVRMRVDSWINPWVDPNGRSYQIVQALLAMGSGGLLGRGPGMGSPEVVPIQHSDFIFAAIVEETGLLGAIGLLLLIGLLIIRGLRIALYANNSFHRYLAVGLTSYLGFQSLLIIGGNIRLLPLTGVPLPFVSYGGSSLVTSFLAILLLTHISNSDEREAAPILDSRPILNLAFILISLLGAAVLVTGWWTVIRGPDILNRSDNPRPEFASLNEENSSHPKQ